MRAGIKQFIFVSSIAAQTGPSSDKVLIETDEPAPTTAYGRSKLEAEKKLASLELPLTILRPVVVFGKQAKGSFHSLEKLASLPVPLPFNGFDAKRSILSVENFCSAVSAVLSNRSCLGETYIVADPTPRSVPQMISEIRASRSMSASLFSIPTGLLQPLFMLGGVWEQIGRPLVADSQKLRNIGWEPIDGPLHM
jgi:UDP-glucose 4-epimerase